MTEGELQPGLSPSVYGHLLFLQSVGPDAALSSRDCVLLQVESFHGWDSGS